MSRATGDARPISGILPMNAGRSLFLDWERGLSPAGDVMGTTPAFVSQIGRLWSRLSRAQRVALIGTAGGALAFTFLFLGLGRQQTFVTAFTNLDAKDSAAIVEQLKANKIPYQVSADGSTIKVPPRNLADARLKLAAKGLPAGGQVGFELFDKTSFGVTDFVQHLNYQRALEGELARTISTLEQVEAARVHIVVPKQELFLSQQKPATASVVLRLRPGRTLDENALRGIAYLVARSVEGLDTKNITVLDASGRILYDGSRAEPGTMLSATQLEMQQKVEKGIEERVQSLLDRVAGPGRAAVRVRAELDFSQREQTSETYTPGGPNNDGVPRSKSTVKETFKGNAGSGGQPGTATNVPNPNLAGALTTGSVSDYTRDETTTNYEVSKNVERRVVGPGEIKRLSVSVVLDSSIPEQDALGLRDAVAAAAGVNPQRGDQLVVTTAAFTGGQGGEAPPLTKAGPEGLVTYAKLAVPLLAALLVLVVVWRMSRSVTPTPLGASAATVPPALVGAAAAALSPSPSHTGVAGGEAPVALPEPARRFETPEQARRRAEIQERMTNLALANPEAVVEIIHSWMAQDDAAKKK
jgi:flagellar M-ring protein FliF